MLRNDTEFNLFRYHNPKISGLKAGKSEFNDFKQLYLVIMISDQADLGVIR